MAVVSAVAAGGLLAGSAQAASTGATTKLVSTTTDQLVPDAESGNASVSRDGRYVAFDSAARNLVKGNPDGGLSTDVFVRDTKTNVTAKVSTGLQGYEAWGTSYDPDISADGRYVVFISNASNLIKGGTTLTGIYVKDLKTGKITLVSRSRQKGQLYNPTISDNGGAIAFESSQSDLVTGDTNGLLDSFVWTRATGKIVRANVTSSGQQMVQGNAPTSVQVSDTQISGDGKWVVFSSKATMLVKGDTNLISDVFLHHVTTGKTSRITGPAGQQVTGGVLQVGDGPTTPALSADGRYIAFEGSSLKGLVPRNTGQHRMVYVYDRITRKTRLISKNRSGNLSTGNAHDANLSPDGRFVEFTSSGSDLVAKDTNGSSGEDVFVTDLKTGRTLRASVSQSGKQANHFSSRTIGGGISNGGDPTVVFASEATNLVPHAVSGDSQVYLHRFGKAAWAK